MESIILRQVGDFLIYKNKLTNKYCISDLLSVTEWMDEYSIELNKLINLSDEIFVDKCKFWLDY